MSFLLALVFGVAVAADIPLAVDAGYSGHGFYRYCPSVMDVAGARHVFYCRNKDAYSVVDHVYHATVSPSGTLVGETVVLAPADTTGTAWDSYHVCDPSVIAGKFHYGGHDYRYLMAYLGVKGRSGDASSDGAKCVNNKVGFAVSDRLETGWTRMGTAPVVVTATPEKWGVGQPSVVSLDGAGKIALFYAGDYGTRMLTLDFSSSEATAASLRTHTGDEGAAVSKAGIGDLKGLRTSGVSINNGDFAWNRTAGCLYLALDTPDRYDDFYDEGDYNLSISKVVTVYRAAAKSLTSAVVANLRWEKVCSIRPNDLKADFTSAFRVHNSGLMRTTGGELAAKTVFVSVAHLQPSPLYTYRFVPVAWGNDRDWFDGGLGASDREPWGGAWSADAPKRDGVMVLDGPDTQQIGFQASEGRQMRRNGCVARIAADVTFEYESALRPPEPQAKAGLTVFGGAYWGLGADPDGGASNVWRRLAGKTPVLDAPVSIMCEINRVNGGNQVAYSIDGETVGTFPVVLQDTVVSQTTFEGNGLVSSLAGTSNGGASEGLSVILR